MRFRPTIDLAIYAVHAAFWSVFIVTRFVLRRQEDPKQKEDDAGPGVSGEVKVARFSRALLAFHGLIFGVLFVGLGRAVIPGHVPHWFIGQRIVAVIIIASGAVLMSSSLVHFRSWWVRAKLEKGHRLATTGPYRFLRHPIYLGMNLLALGTAIWVPTIIEWVAFGLMAIGCDLRARAEEGLLDEAFGLPYREYRSRTWRFIPGIY
jgi:protein-S-isoprenylcysteine O-methyltransferase Ste14